MRRLLAYVTPSALLHGSRHAEVPSVAAELDGIFERIVARALAAR